MRRQSCNRAHAESALARGQGTGRKVARAPAPFPRDDCFEELRRSPALCDGGTDPEAVQYP
eukprot:11593860-Prorocentrum_lima.AAC.1